MSFRSHIQYIPRVFCHQLLVLSATLNAKMIGVDGVIEFNSLTEEFRDNMRPVSVSTAGSLCPSEQEGRKFLQLVFSMVARAVISHELHEMQQKFRFS